MIYSLSFELDEQVSLGKISLDASHRREDVIARFNDYCSDLRDSDDQEPSFFGVTEGVLLAEEAHARGYETESWVLDEGVAPHERDWLSQEKSLKMIAYFKDQGSAKLASIWLSEEYRLKAVPLIASEEEKDWNATWKTAFTGIVVDENLKVLPPWNEEWIQAKEKQDTLGIIAINPGAGFGTGTHETTQLCLKVLSGLGDLTGKTVLDFGSGSGILGIAAAMRGAKVYCVEVDRMAIENAQENAALNSVEDRVVFSEFIPDELKNGQVDILLANILRPILVRFCQEIKSCLKPDAELVLSGLIEPDLEQVITTYQEGGSPFQINRYEKNEWRALWLRRGGV